MIASSNPTHWLSDQNKLPDIIDFFIDKNLSSNYAQITTITDLSSNHIPVVLKLILV